MAEYCVHCGKKITANMKFCPNCGRSRIIGANKRPPAQTRNVSRNNNSSGGIWKFFAGAGVGAFFTSLFGNSSASASNSTHTETVENYHDTLVYERGYRDEYGEYDEYDYDKDCACEYDCNDDYCDDGGYDDYE